MIKTIQIVFACGVLILAAQQSPAEQRLTILHTNDLHSHLLGAAPNIAYSPATTDDDRTLGGFARIATLIQAVRQKNAHPVLVLDSGDFLMGSLFHMLSRERAFELRLMHQMGYDALTLGNHEFDLKPGGLARILESARQYGQLPAIVSSNLIFDPGGEDDDLEKAFAAGLIKPYQVLEKGGLRIGLFGLMGNDAAEVAPFASPVQFADPLATAQKWVEKLRKDEKVDLIVCLSHGGLDSDPDKSEDEVLARGVDGIDVIISGHTHSRMDRALTVNGTVIVQAWEYGKQVGILDLAIKEGGVHLTGYNVKAIDDSLPGDERITRQIAGYETEINRAVLNEMGLGFNQTIATTDFDLTIGTTESNLGNLITDAIRWDVNRHLSALPNQTARVSVGVISNGVIRDPIIQGQTGAVAVCDVFRAIPLGIGFDEAETMGYPLIALYLYPTELKKALEILTSIYPLKGSDYFLQLSGVRFSYNPHRMIFDRVTDIWLGDDQSGYTRLNYGAGNRTLIGVTADIYNATFLKVIGSFTWQILEIVPKHADGTPIDDLREVRVDSDPTRPGIQELKEWQAVMAYIRQMPDSDADGLANISARYRGPLERQIIAASINPIHLLKRGSWITRAAFAIIILVIALLTTAVVFAGRRLSR